jgi:hypothetical protein
MLSKRKFEALYFVGFEFLTAMVMKNSVFFDIMAVQSVEGQLAFRRNISPPSSMSKNKPSKKPA